MVITYTRAKSKCCHGARIAATSIGAPTFSSLTNLAPSRPLVRRRGCKIRERVKQDADCGLRGHGVVKEEGGAVGRMTSHHPLAGHKDRIPCHRPPAHARTHARTRARTHTHTPSHRPAVDSRKNIYTHAVVSHVILAVVITIRICHPFSSNKDTHRSSNNDTQE